MDKFLIKGPCKIKGQIFISGSKNAALPILAATLLFDKTVIIENLPRVRDIDTMLNLLKSLALILGHICINGQPLLPSNVLIQH